MSETTGLSHCPDCGQEYQRVLVCRCPQVTDARLAHSPLSPWVMCGIGTSPIGLTQGVNPPTHTRLKVQTGQDSSQTWP